MDSVLVVFITCPDHKSADEIAVRLVEQRHAACVNVIPGLTSVYRWAGKIEKDQEVLLVAKTTHSAFVGLKTAVQTLHPADLPEIIALPVSDGLPEYLQWVNAETSEQ